MKNSSLPLIPLLKICPPLVMYAGNAHPTCTSECNTIAFLVRKFSIYLSKALDKASVVIRCPSLSTISTEAGPPTTITASGSTSLTALTYAGVSGYALARVNFSALEAIPALNRREYSSKASAICSCVVAPPFCPPFSSHVS